MPILHLIQRSLNSLQHEEIPVLLLLAVAVALRWLALYKEDLDATPDAP